MSTAPADLSKSALDFLSEYHLATLSTLRADGSPHVARDIDDDWFGDGETSLVGVRDITAGEGGLKQQGEFVGRAVCRIHGRTLPNSENFSRLVAAYLAAALHTFATVMPGTLANPLCPCRDKNDQPGLSRSTRERNRRSIQVRSGCQKVIISV